MNGRVPRPGRGHLGGGSHGRDRVGLRVAWARVRAGDAVPTAQVLSAASSRSLLRILPRPDVHLSVGCLGAPGPDWSLAVPCRGCWVGAGPACAPNAAC